MKIINIGILAHVDAGKTVSYTHLDVYKRQEESKCRRTMIQLVSTADAAFLRRKASLIIPMG